jgi:zinc protease
MDDLSAASLEDVNQFFRTYYAPNNASIAIVGAVNTDEVRRMVERYFGGIPRGAAVQRPTAPMPPIPATRYITREDRVTSRRCRSSGARGRGSPRTRRRSTRWRPS